MDRGDRQKPEVIWRDGLTPVSPRFDDPFFSHGDGLAETRHVFLAGNDLPERFHDGFQIAELGFGTGRNALAAALAWTAAGQSGALRFTSFEAYPLAADDIARALGNWPELLALAGPLVRQWRTGARRIDLPGLELTVIEGDARRTLPDWTGQADAWFLDGFSPARNPEMWEADLLLEVGRHTRPGGTVATYSAAGIVRERLAAAGFLMERVPGHGAKRHMSRGRRRLS